MKMRCPTYDDLRKWVDVFLAGKLDIFIIEGSAGAGKSTTLRQRLKGEPDKDFCWVEGRTSAAALYERLYHCRDLPIILDDVDSLYKERESVNLLKCLCQTESVKSIQWNTLARRKDRDVPPMFTTKSKVAIITNCWRSLNKHVSAVEDRGLLLLFHPVAKTVHEYVMNELSSRPDIFDQEIYDFIGEHLGLIKDPSIRFYRTSLNLKAAGMPWKEALIESFGLTDKEMLVLKLWKDRSLSNHQRATLFAQELNLSRRTYFRIKADLEGRGMYLGGEPNED